MQELKKKYQYWTRSDGNTWDLTEYDTLEEIVKLVKYNDFYITKKVDMEITDKEEANIIPNLPFSFDNDGCLYVKVEHHV